MKRKMIEKVLAVTMVVAMAMPLAACGNNVDDKGGNSGQQSEEKDEDGDTEDEEFDEDNPFAKYTKGEVVEDMEGYEFLIIDYSGPRWYPDNGEVKKDEDALKISIIEDVEEKFNCKITVEQEAPDQIFNNAQPAVMGADKYADVIGVTEWGFGPLLAADMLLDLSTVDSIDLTADYWNKNVIDFVTFGNATYGIGGSFATDFTNQGVIFYNQRIWEEITLADGSKLPGPKELLDNNEWTWDKLLECARAAARDMDGDGKIDSEADRYGIAGPLAAIYERMVIGMGENYIAKDADGKLSLGLTTDIAAEKLNWLYRFFNTENVIDFTHVQATQVIDKFVAGETLFMLYANTGDSRLKEMEDDWGILPIPKWNSGQAEYYCEVDSNAPLFCMTNTNQNAYKAGVILSALARRFQAVEELQINDRLSTLYRLEETEDIIMNYIWKHASYEPVSLIKETNSVFKQPTTILENAAWGRVADIPSEMKAHEEEINIALDEFFSGLSK